MFITGRPPFDGVDDQEIIKSIRIGKYTMDGDIWDHVGDEIKDLISKMLCKEQNRLSAKEVIHHPWFEFMASLEGHEESHAKQQLISRALFNLKHFSTKNKVKQSALGYLI